MPISLIYLGLLITMIFSLGGCLKTRDDLKTSEMAAAMNRQVTDLQKVNADSASRLDDIDSAVRSVNGRMEELEHRMKTDQEQKKNQEDQGANATLALKQQNDLLRESVTKLETEVQAIKEMIVELKATKAAAPEKKESNKESNKSVGSNSEGGGNAFQRALSEFNDKNWQKAILSFDKYRGSNPKGKFIAEATYKTGVCFQELGMKEEAKVFYQETLAKFPQSDMAKKAQYRLKSLK